MLHRITGTTKLLGVIGDPIEHSLSPVMHNAAIAHLGVDYVYLPFHIRKEKLEVAIAGFAAIGVGGFSVTIPHKQAIMPLLSEVSDIARSVGAVNTVWRTDRGWNGTNTDVSGFIAPLQAQNRDWSKTTAVILGCGGAARAVVIGCFELGCRNIHVLGRNQQKLTEFQQSWVSSPHELDKPASLPTSHPSSLVPRPYIHPWERLPQLISQANLLVNTTPVGMSPKIEESPVDVEVMHRLTEGAIAYDLIYTPNPTRFLQQAAQQGAITIDGLEMLVQQGAAALEIWLGQTPPVDIMRRSLQQHLGLLPQA